MEQNSLIANHSPLFTSPKDGAVQELNPPPFFWRGIENVSFTVIVEIRRDDKDRWDSYLTFETEVNAYLPESLFEQGHYRWDLTIGNGSVRRGWFIFEVTEDSQPFQPPSASDILNRISPTYPSHIYAPQDLETIRQVYGEELEILKRNITVALSNPAPQKPMFHRREDITYRESFGAYRDAVDRDMVACTLGYLLLKDRRAGAKAKDSFMTIIDWNPNGPCSVLGSWGDEIGLSNCRTLFSCYDWLSPLFNEKERQYIVQTLTQYALQMEERLKQNKYVTYPVNSHAGRLPGYLGEAAMILWRSIDEDLCKRWLSQSLLIFSTFYPFYGGDHGGWAEGPFYGSSYSKWHIPFFLAVEKHTGFSFFERPFYHRVSHFFSCFAPPGRDSFPFSDGNWCSRGDKEWPGFSAQNPFREYSKRFGPSLSKEFSQQLSKSEIYKLHLLDIFTIPREPPSPCKTDVSQSSHFIDVGLASMHICIENPSRDTALFFRASPFGAISHQHRDMGNFALIYHNRTILGPSGFFGFQFGTDHHKQWTRMTKAHNCLLINGQGQDGSRESVTGKIISLKDSDQKGAKPGSFCEILMDLTEAYNKAGLPLISYKRRVLYERPYHITITDILHLNEKCQVDVRLHSGLNLNNSYRENHIVTIIGDEAHFEISVHSASCEDAQFTMTDSFEPSISERVSRSSPRQTHMNWRFLNFSEGEIITKIFINPTCRNM